MLARNHLPSSLIRILDLIAFIASGFIAQAIYEEFKGVSLDTQRYAAMILLGALVFILLNNKLYRSWRSEGFFKLWQTAFIVIIKTWLIIIIWLLFSKTNLLYSRIWLLLWAFLACFSIIFLRYLIYILMGQLRTRGFNVKNVVIIGDNSTIQEIQTRIQNNPLSGFAVTKIISNPSDLDLQSIALEPYDEIWLTFGFQDQLRINQLMEGLKDSTANVRLVPDWFSYRLINHGVSEVLGIQMVDLFGTPMTGKNLLIKTIEDYFITIFVLIIFAPLFAVLALLVKLSSPGPVFYKQMRVGWNGQVFEMLKFRTMPVDFEKENFVWGNSSNKPVAHPISRWMRKTSLDELPQFFNVLKGEMSIVGPRPERPEFVEHFKKEIPGYMKKHLVKAGITGWAQIHGWRGDTDLKARIEHDLFYIDNWSLFLDLKIIIYTPFYGLMHKNAY
jgi:putative colanic acid biosynthesis UDP-glucose lipid carrier transferase